MANWPKSDERDILASRAIVDLRFFLREVLGLVHPDNSKSGWWEPAHDKMVAWLQKHGDEWLTDRKVRAAGKKYMMAIVPRNCAKTQVITIGFNAWLMVRAPDLFVALGNESYGLAQAFLGGIKGHISLPESGRAPDWHLFVWLFGDWSRGAKKWAQDEISHGMRASSGKDPSILCFSPTSAITGRHPDIGNLDDLVSYDAYKRDANWNDVAYGCMVDLIPAVEPNGLIIYSGTRYGDNDPAGRSLREDGIATLTGHQHGPYQPTEGGRWHVLFFDALDETGEPEFPKTWPQREIDLYCKKDPVKGASQLRNDPKKHGLMALTDEQFLLCTVKRDTLPESMDIVLSLDCGFKERAKKGASESVIMVAGCDWINKPGHWFVLDSHHSATWRSEQFLELLINTHMYWENLGHRVIAITDEDTPGGKGGTWEALIQSKYTDSPLQWAPPYICINRMAANSKGKDQRISDAVAFVVQGCASFVEGGIGMSVLREQLTGHPYSAMKDHADAFADLFHKEVYHVRVPALTMAKEKPEYGGYELQAKGNYRNYGIIDEEMDYDRAPVGRSG